MVSSVGSAPYSYLDQLTKKTAPAVPVKDTGGLSPEVTALLRNIGGDSTVNSLLGDKASTTSDNPFASLFGYSTSKTTSSILSDTDDNLFTLDSSAGIYQAAFDGASSKKASASLGEDRMNKILAAYNAVVSQKAPGVNITG